MTTSLLLQLAHDEFSGRCRVVARPGIQSKAMQQRLVGLIQRITPYMDGLEAGRSQPFRLPGELLESLTTNELVIAGPLLKCASELATFRASLPNELEIPPAEEIIRRSTSPRPVILQSDAIRIRSKEELCSSLAIQAHRDAVDAEQFLASAQQAYAYALEAIAACPAGVTAESKGELALAALFDLGAMQRYAKQALQAARDAETCARASERLHCQEKGGTSEGRPVARSRAKNAGSGPFAAQSSSRSRVANYADVAPFVLRATNAASQAAQLVGSQGVLIAGLDAESCQREAEAIARTPKSRRGPNVPAQVAPCIAVTSQWYGFDFVLDQQCTKAFEEFLDSHCDIPNAVDWIKAVYDFLVVATKGTALALVALILRLDCVLISEDLKRKDKGRGATLHLSLLQGIAMLLLGPEVLGVEELLEQAALLLSAVHVDVGNPFLTVFWITGN